MFLSFGRNNKEGKMAVRADVGFMRADAEEIMKRIQMNSGVIGVSVIDCNGKSQLWPLRKEFQSTSHDTVTDGAM